MNVAKRPNKSKGPFAHEFNSWPANNDVFSLVWALATQTVVLDLSSLFRWIHSADKRRSAFACCKGRCLSGQQGRSAKSCLEHFRNWSTFLNPDPLHRLDVEHAWCTWQTRLVAYHANNPKSGKERNRGHRGGSILPPLTASVLVMPLHPSIHAPTLPAPASPVLP